MSLLVVAVLGVAIVSVPLAGGRLGALAHVRFKSGWALLAAFLAQATIFLVTPRGPSSVLATVHIATYLLACYFVIANRRVPGLWLIGLGGALNLAAISANGGVMPAAPNAARVAGMTEIGGHFANSSVTPGASLHFLGDMFAIPSSWPISNVFSIGDVCIALGLFVALHQLCASRLLPSGSGQFSSLVEHPNFIRVWGAQAISNLGDWVYALAVVTSLVQTTGAAHALAFLMIAQVGPAALAGVLGGPVIDRFSRKTILLVSDVARCAAVASLLIGGAPSLTHLYLVAACLGVFEAMFQPALQASLPNLVPKERLVAANALVSATFNFAVMGGPILGGLLVARMGLRPVLVLNAASFAVSGALVLISRLPRPQVSLTRAALRDLKEGLRYSLATPLVRGIFAITAMIMLASAIRSPLEPLFVMRTLGEPVGSLGLLGGVWGLGMLIGSAATPAAARAWAREHLLAASVVGVGLAVIVASQALSFVTVLFCWFLCGIGNAVGTVSYESMLQERTPDRLRGRVMAASESVLNIAYLAGAGAVAFLGTQLHIRAVYALSGGLFLAAAWMCRMMLGQAAPLPGEATSSEDVPAHAPQAVPAPASTSGS